MNQAVIPVLIILASYLLGAVPFGYLVARWRGLDILHAGSGNIGATNVGRVLGPRYGVLVFLLDFAKGAIPVLVAFWLATSTSTPETASWSRETLGVAAGLAALLGHLFPVYLRFHGGKGVATGAGVVAMLLPIPALAALIVWVSVFCATRYVSLASLTAALALVAVRLEFTEGAFVPANRILTIFSLVAMALVFARHRSNIARLLNHQENQFALTPRLLTLTKSVHVLSLGLWYGTAVFFLVATLLIFQTFELLGSSDVHRPAWLPVTEDFDREKGTQLAGVAVAPLFDWYFPLQVACGFLALGTAASLLKAQPDRKVHRYRVILLTLALATALLGWPLAQYVGRLRLERYSFDLAMAGAAKALFGRWHLFSLLLNFVTLGLVIVAMALAGQLPNQESGIGNQESGIGNRRSGIGG